MTRHSRLPDNIRAELPVRGRAGTGHDLTFPTETGAGVVPAEAARWSRPSAQMLALVQQVSDYLLSCGAEHVDVMTDLRRRGMPGAFTLRWFKGVPPATVAAKFAVSEAADGTPLVPAWLSLRADDDFDLRWQVGY